MLRTGDQYRESIRDGRDVWMDGIKIEDVTTHLAFKPIVDVRARIYDMAHEADLREQMVYSENGENFAIGLKMPKTHEDWAKKRDSVATIMKDIGGVVTRVGDETAGEMWSLYDGSDILDEVDPRFSKNIKNHIQKVIETDTFHVSANTDPKGDRSKAPQDQDPDMLMHVVKETDEGIVVRGAKFETAAAYANQAFVKPTIANWGDAKLSEYALGFICPMNAKGLKHICRSGFAAVQGKTKADYPLSNGFDEVDTLLIFDNVLIPWKDVLFYQHTRAASFIRGTLHRYSAYAFTLRILHIADLLIGTAMFNIKQTGLNHQPAVREKIAQLVCYREGINAHLSASINMGERSPGDLLMPNQSLLYAGRVLACSQFPEMIHLTRELCGGQVCVTPNAAAFEEGETPEWMTKFYTINEFWDAADRRKLLAFGRDLVNSDYAGHKITFQLFAQSPPFAHLNAVYNNFDFTGAMNFVHKSAGLSGKVLLQQ